MGIEFPRNDDTVFADVTRGGRATLMSTGRMGPHELGLMAGGYKEGADILVEQLDARGRNDSLVYPILFGYRQYLELRIKALGVLIKRWDEVDEDFKRTHDLKHLWQSIRERLAGELQEEDRDAFQVAESLIAEFHEIDPRSDRFRYPSDIEQMNLDLRRVHGVVKRLSDFLDSMADWWQAGIDARG